MLLNKTPAIPDIKNRSGSVDYSLLEPKIGESYNGRPELTAVLTDLNSGKFQDGLQKLDRHIQDKPSNLDGVRLKAEVYATFEYHLAAWEQFELILKVEPYDKQALFMTLVLAIVLGETEEASIRQEKLRKAHPQLEKKLTILLQFVAQYQHKTNFEDQIKEMTSIDVLAVYGFGLAEDGTVPLALKSRLEKTVAYAERFPMADIIVSGGAVTTPFNEAIEMKKWLVQHGVRAGRILLDSVAKDTVGNAIGITEIVKTKTYRSCCVITSLTHLPRAWMSLVARFKKENMAIPVYGAAYEAPNSLEVPGSELTLSYHTTLRAAGLFEKNDFEERSR